MTEKENKDGKRHDNRKKELGKERKGRVIKNRQRRRGERQDRRKSRWIKQRGRIAIWNDKDGRWYKKEVLEEEGKIRKEERKKSTREDEQ